MILDSMYNDERNGYAGNEDCGQMSAWFVWNAVGFYPANPVSGEYVFGSPIADVVVMTLPNGKKMRVVAKNNSHKNKFIQKVTLNGTAYSKTYITHESLLKGGELIFTMGSLPNKNFGKLAKDWPSSL